MQVALIYIYWHYISHFSLFLNVWCVPTYMLHKIYFSLKKPIIRTNIATKFSILYTQDACDPIK